MPNWKKLITSGSDAVLNSLSLNTHLSASSGYFSGSENTLKVIGSGSTVFDIQGSQGQLFSVTDQLSGSLFSVNDISGIPVFEAFSDDTIKMGTFGSEAIVVVGSQATIQNLQATGSFSGSFIGNGSGLTDLNYNNISNPPTIGNGTLTLGTTGIATGGTTFTANQTNSSTFTVNVPGTDLAMGGSGDNRSITSSTGNNVSIPIVTTSDAGFMSIGDKSKLDGIDANANNYIHPTFNGDDVGIDTGVLTGATVISDLDFNLTTNTEGHVVDANGVVSTRNLTASDIGAQPAGNYDNYQYWNLKTNGTQRKQIQSTNNLDLVEGTNVSIGYSAGGVVTISSTDTNTNDIDYISDVNLNGSTLEFTGVGNAFNSNVDLSSLLDDTNNYVNSISFDTSNGILTLGRSGLPDLDEDLDGRYILDEEPNPPTNLILNQINNTVIIQFDSSGNYDRYEVWSSVGNTNNYNLIGVFNTDIITGTMELTDDTFNKNGIIYYSVYSIKNGKYSTALTGSINVTGNVPDPSNMKVMETLHGYHIEWELPNDPRLQQVEVYVHSSPTFSGLSESLSTNFYTGLSTSTFFTPSETDSNNFHQFWVSSVTRT